MAATTMLIRGAAIERPYYSGYSPAYYGYRYRRAVRPAFAYYGGAYPRGIVRHHRWHRHYW
jgi:hypothetical protein